MDRQLPRPHPGPVVAAGRRRAGVPVRAASGQDQRVPGRGVGAAAGREQPQAAQGRGDRGAVGGRRRGLRSGLGWRTARSPTTRSRRTGGSRCRSPAPPSRWPTLKQEALDLTSVVGTQPADGRTQAFDRTEEFLAPHGQPDRPRRAARRAPGAATARRRWARDWTPTRSPWCRTSSPSPRPLWSTPSWQLRSVVGLLSAASPVANALRRPGTTVEDVGRLWRTAPPTLAAVDAARSRSIAATLVIVDSTATPVVEGRRGPGGTRVRPFERVGLARAAARTKGSVLPTGAAPPTARRSRPPRPGRPRRRDRRRTDSTAFGKALTAGRRMPGDPGAVLDAGDVAVLRLPNARHDVGRPRDRPGLLRSGVPRHGCWRSVPVPTCWPTSVATDAPASVPQGTERLVAIGLGHRPSRPAPAWTAGTPAPRCPTSAGRAHSAAAAWSARAVRRSGRTPSGPTPAGSPAPSWPAASRP